jgi:Na+-driven multidrug efflux pump
MSAMVAMNIGANRWDRVDQIALRGCLISLAISCAATLLIYSLGDLPLRLFIPGGGPALETALRINVIALWGWIALAVTMGLFAVVRANGAMLAPTIIFAVTMWILRVPFALLLKPWLGDASIWWSYPFGAISSALIAYGYYRMGRWRERPLMLMDVNGVPEDTPLGE